MSTQPFSQSGQMIELFCGYFSVKSIWVYVLIISRTRFSSNIWSVWLNAWLFVYELSGCEFESCCSYWNFKYRVCFEQGVFDIETTIEGSFTLKLVPDMIWTYSQMHHTDKCSQYSSINWPLWLNGCVFVYKLSSCGF